MSSKLNDPYFTKMTKSFARIYPAERTKRIVVISKLAFAAITSKLLCLHFHLFQDADNMPKSKLIIRKFKSAETYREADILNMSQDTQNFPDDSIDVSPNDLSFMEENRNDKDDGKSSPLVEILNQQMETLAVNELELEEATKKTEEIMAKFEQYKKVRLARLKHLQEINKWLASLKSMNRKDQKKAIQFQKQINGL